MDDEEDINARIEAAEDRLEEHERLLTSHGDLLAKLQADVAEIKPFLEGMKATLGDAATKVDIAELRAAMEHAMGQVLGKALNSVPAWQAAAWAGVAASIGIVALLHALGVI